jgi:hypothetical protein
VENVTFSTELRGVGIATGDIPLYGDGLAASRVLRSTLPHRTKLFIQRNQALVWGGRLIPPRDFDSTTRRATLNAEQTLGIADKRFLPTLTYTATDQFAIARDLLVKMQAAEGNVNLLATPGNSGVLRDRAYAMGDQTTVLSALTDLSEVEGGFEFSSQVIWDNNNLPQETVLLGYPRLGRAYTGLVFEYADGVYGGGGNVSSYTWSDSEGLYTRSWAVAETDEGVQLVAHADNTTLLAAGYPLIEQTQSFDGVVDLATLQAHANAMAIFAAGNHAMAQFVVRATANLQLGDWQDGDNVMVRLSDWRFPPDPVTGAPGFAAYMRIVGVEVTPPAVGTDEIYTFTLADYIEVI